MELFPGATKCVGCGLCCVKATCGVGQRLYGESRPCPALRWDEEESRHYCKLCEFPGRHGELYRLELSVGAGCCMSLCNSWREDLQDRTKVVLEGNLVNPLPKLLQTFLRSLGKFGLMSSAQKEEIIRIFEMEVGIEFGVETAKVYRKWATHSMLQNNDDTFKSMMG